MAEINIAQEQQKKIKAKKMRRNQTFAELMNYSKVEAAQYAIDCGINTQIDGISVQDYVDAHNKINKEEKSTKNNENETTNTGEQPKTNTLNKKELQELLKTKNIPFGEDLTRKQLLEIAELNDLL